MNIPGIAAIPSPVRGENIYKETTETLAPPKAEAAKDDRQAALKLAALNAISAATGIANLSGSTGNALNKVA